jgi:16S rRNA processing protein RimM
MRAEGSGLIVVGQVGSPYGVRGWVHVHSYTEPKENIVAYSPWRLRLAEGWFVCDVTDLRCRGKDVIAKFSQWDEREAVRQLLGAEIAILRTQLPALEEGEYYWTDLVGLKVVNVEGIALGRVEGLMATGANDVLIANGERVRLIPFLMASVVRAIDLEQNRIQVDWDPEF